MATKIIAIVGVSIASVAVMYILGRYADKDAAAKEDPSPRHDAA